MKNLRTKLLATFASFGLTAALIAVLSFSMSVSQKPASVSADSVTGVVGYTLLAGNGATATTTSGTAVNLRFFGTADCYSEWVAGPVISGAPVTITNKLQHSFDGVSGWVDLYTFPVQTAAATSFTRTHVLGGFMRVSQTAGNANPVTTTVKCMAKNVVEGR